MSGERAAEIPAGKLTGLSVEPTASVTRHATGGVREGSISQASMGMVAGRL